MTEEQNRGKGENRLPCTFIFFSLSLTHISCLSLTHTLFFDLLIFCIILLILSPPLTPFLTRPILLLSLFLFLSPPPITSSTHKLKNCSVTIATPIEKYNWETMPRFLLLVLLLALTSKSAEALCCPWTLSPVTFLYYSSHLNHPRSSLQLTIIWNDLIEFISHWVSMCFERRVNKN